MDRHQWIDSLFRNHAEDLFRYLRTFRLPEDETYDLVQAAFLAILKEDLDSIQRPRSWLFTVGRNLAINSLRSGKRSVSGIEIDEKPGDEPLADEVMIQGESDEELWQAFAKLPQRDQELLRLQILDELSTREIADVLAMSESAVRVALHRARQRLREVVESLDEEPVVATMAAMSLKTGEGT